MNTPPNAAALLPCPFCGSANITLRGELNYDGRWAGCEDCGVTACEVAIKSDVEAIAAWNRRTGLTPSQDELVAENERLREFVESISKSPAIRAFLRTKARALLNREKTS